MTTHPKSVLRRIHILAGPALGACCTLSGCTSTGLFAPTTQPNRPIEPQPRVLQEPPQIVTAQPTQLYDATIPVQHRADEPGTPGAPAGHQDILKFIERVEAAQAAAPHSAPDAYPARNSPGNQPGVTPAADATPAAERSPVIGVLRAPREPLSAPAVAPREPYALAADPLNAAGSSPPPPAQATPAADGFAAPGESASGASAAPRIREVVTAAAVASLPEDRPIVSPALNTPTAAQTGPRSLREYLASQPLPTGGGSFRAQLDQRILWLLAGDDEQALAPLEQVSQAQQELATRYLAALRVIRDAHLGDLSGAANRAARELDSLRAQLAEVGDLSIPTLVLCSAVQGFGQYDPLEPPRFVAGRASEFVVYCEVRDFTSERRGDGHFHLSFDLTTSVLDAQGRTRFELQDREITDRSRNRRQDCFLPRLIRLPADLPTGEYTLKVVLTDRLGQKVVEKSTRFELTRGG